MREEEIFGFTDKKKNKTPQLAVNLYKKPKKDVGKNMPTINVLNAGETQQADLLFMPHDGDYKYILVVVDLGSRMTDAVPLKAKSNNDVIDGFKLLFNRGILKVPKRLEVDAGAEFKGKTAKYLKGLNIWIRVAKVGRHRQQALVERRNQTIAKALFFRMAQQELLTGEESREWVEDLPRLLKLLNKRKIKPSSVSTDPVCEGDSCKVLDTGTKVRVALDYPINAVTEKRLHGKFRTTDLRFSPVVRTIKEVLIKPNSPPLYLLDGNVCKRKVDITAYTKNQLQVIPKNEKLPNPAVIRGKPKTFKVQKILDRKKINGKIFFKVSWLGYSKPTFEPRTSLIEDIPDLIKTYERDNKPFRD